MNATPDSPPPSRALLIAALVFVAVLGIRTISTGSFWMHLASGRDIAEHGIAQTDPFSFATDAGRSWMNETWLYDWLLYKIWQLGAAPAVTAVHVASVVAAFALLALGLRVKVGSVITSLALLSCGWLMAPQFTASPFTFAMILPALFIVVLSRAATHRLAVPVLVVAQVLWANLHPSFLLGPLLGTLALLQSRSADANGQRGVLAPRQIALVALLLAATLVNPYGIRLPAGAIRRLFDPDFGLSLEWVSPYVTAFSFPWGRYLVTVVLAFVAAGFIFIRNRLPILITTIAVLGAFLLVRSIQHSALSAILIFPFLCLSVHAMTGVVGDRSLRLRRAGAFATATVVVLSVFTMLSNAYYCASGNTSAFGLGIQEDAFPVHFVAEAIPDGRRMPSMLNLPMDGGYLAWHRPGDRIFCDTRMAIYGARFYREFQSALRGDAEKWKILESRWQPRALLFNCTWLGAAEDIRTLLLSGAWALAYFDGTSALLVMDKASPSPGIRRAGLQILEVERRAYEQRLNDLLRPGNPSRLIGAASVFQALGRYREAEALFLLLARGTPTMSSAWLGLCNSQIEQLKFERALETMQITEKRLSRQSRVWLWTSLSRAYARTGRNRDSVDAMSRARALDERLANALSGTNAAHARR